MLAEYRHPERRTAGDLLRRGKGGEIQVELRVPVGREKRGIDPREGGLDEVEGCGMGGEMDRNRIHFVADRLDHAFDGDSEIA
jgi:hypothetical protein